MNVQESFLPTLLLELFCSVVLHQQLPSDLSEIGNKFVRAEFEQHRSVTDPKALGLFFGEWEKVINQ